MTINCLTIDLATREELCNIFIGRPVDWHTQVITVLLFEVSLVLIIGEPVVAEPVQIGELLIWKLVQLAIRTCGEFLANEVVDIKRRQCDISTFTGHPVGQIACLLITPMSTDQIGVIDIGVINILTRLHLCLQFLNHITFTDKIMSNIDTGDGSKGWRQDLGLILVSRNGLGYNLDIHTSKGFGRIDKPLHLCLLLIVAEH